MKQLGIGFVAVVFLAIAAAPAYADCTCDAAKVKNGWCADCKVGYFDSVKIKAKKLFGALEGKEVDVAALKCESCKNAVKKDGFCKQCKQGFVSKKQYTSKLAYTLAKGEAQDASKIKCESCKKNAEKYGWCEACKVGMVGNVAFKDKDDFKKASESHDVLLAAVKAADKCETCAIAMVTDGKCDACKISYKGGKKVKAEEP